MFAASKTASTPTGGYQISRSLRFNSADSAYLSRTPASAGNRKTWTQSFWIKNSVSVTTSVFGIVQNGSQTQYRVLFNSDSKLRIFSFESGSFQFQFLTTQVFRDFSAWQHIQIALDTTQATQANRFKLYVNGVQVTAFDTATYPTQNTDCNWNIASLSQLGASGDTTEFLQGYLTEINFVDGTQLTPSSFGQTDAQTGVWSPIAYSGTYGTNGFYLKFLDNSNTTAATLGKDYSGNGNNWTPNNFSVTAGAGNDSLVDSPTSYAIDTAAGGEVRGNYCTLNPLANLSTYATLSNGNLDVVPNSTNYPMVPATFGMTTGQWYWEYTLGATGNAGRSLGIVKSTATVTNFIGSDANGWGYYGLVALKFNNGTSTAYGSTYTNGDVIGVAFDADAGTLVFYKNGTSQGTAFSSLTSGPYFPAWSAADNAQTGTTSLNFGQRPFASLAPSGYKALCTQNLVVGTITTSGSFTGNLNADGPFVYLNGVPTAMTINGNAVTFGTNADKLSNGFKVRSSSSLYNNNVANAYVITSTSDKFKYALAQSNP